MAGLIYTKSNVLFTIIKPAGFKIIAALQGAADETGFDLTITSACDGVHSGLPTDPHPTGEAYDVRCHEFNHVERLQILAAVMRRLGIEHFFGFIESEGAPNEHFHFQRKKGTVYP